MTSKSHDSRYKIFGAKNSPKLVDAYKVNSQSQIAAPTHAALPTTAALNPSIQPQIFQNLSYPLLFPVPTPPYFPLPSPLTSPYFAHPMMSNTHYDQLF